jgi:hypothetical protein
VVAGVLAAAPNMGTCFALFPTFPHPFLGALHH